MPHWRPIKDPHALSKTDMPHRRQTCLRGDPLETDMPQGDLSETDLTYRRPIRDLHVHRRLIRNTYLAQGSVSNETCLSLNFFWQKL